jgi:hypothetical protein
MASDTSELKNFRCEPRMRIRDLHAEEFTSIADEKLDEINWCEVVDFSVVIYGWKVSFNAGKSFHIEKGAGVVDSRLCKSISTDTIYLDDNTDPINWREDLIEIIPSGLTEGESNPRNEVILGAITRTTVSGEAVGTGDDVATAFYLGHSGVDIRTLVVQINSLGVGGYNVHPGTPDLLVFANPPGFGDVITADYTYQSGGGETSTSVFSRKYQEVAFNIVKGTPGVLNTNWTSGSIKIARIRVPPSWTGGDPGSYNIDNSVKEFLVGPDFDQGDLPLSSPGDAPNVGKLVYPVRNMDQVIHGFRPYWESATQIRLTAGWGVCQGVSFFSPYLITLTVDSGSVPSAGWYYVYLKVPATSSSPPGSPPTLEVSEFPPNWNAKINNYSIQGSVYLFPFYATAAATIRSFYTHGNMILNQGPFYYTLPLGYGNDINITNECPLTGRLILVRLEAALDLSSFAASGEGRLNLLVQSHRIATGVPSPSVFCQVQPQAGVTGVAYDNENTGFVRAEYSGGSMYVRGGYYLTPTVGVNTIYNRLYVLGFIDDYRTMDQDGNPLFY